MSGDAPRPEPAEDLWKQNPKECTEEAEIGLLGAALVDDTGAAAKDLFGVSPEDFSTPYCAAVARAIAATMNGAPAPDGILVAMALRESGELTALTLVKDRLLNWHTGANSRIYAQRIRYFASRRREARIRQRLSSARTPDEQDKIHRELDDFLALEKEEAAGTPAAATSWDMAALRQEPPEPDAIQFVHRLFVRPSVNVVFGPAQAGKSWAIMGLCVDAVTGGGKFLGCADLDIFALHDDFTSETRREERVLWVFGSEDTRARVRRRAETLLEHRELTEHRFVIATPPNGLSLHLEEGWRWLLEQVEVYTPSIVVFDTIGSLTGHTLDVTDANEVIPFLGRLNALRAAKNLIVFALHHTRKGSTDAKKAARDKADSMLGSGAWRNFTEGVLMLDAQDGNTQDVEVVSIKAKDIANPIPPFRACLESPAGRFRVLEHEEVPPERDAVSTARGGRPSKFTADAVLALRPRYPSGLGWNETIVRAALDISRALWFGHQKEVAADLTTRGCSIVDGSLRWPTPGTSAAPSPPAQSSLPGFLDSGSSGDTQSRNSP